jgi:Ca2+-binding RTX toxin-like protein
VGTATVTVVLQDSGGTENGGQDSSAPQTFTIALTNQAPEATDDEASTLHNIPVSVDVLENDTDPDGDGIALDSVSDTENGAASIGDDGLVTYTPNEGFSGTDSFTYVVADPFGGTDTGLVTVSVAAPAELELSGGEAADDGEPDTYRVVLAGDSLELWYGETLRERFPYVATGTITVTGSSDNDTLVIDFTGGNPIPEDGIAFDGGGPEDDDLLVLEGEAGSVSHGFTGPGSGTVDVDDGLVSYTGLEPIIDGLLVAERSFTFSDDMDVVTLGDDDEAGNGFSRIDSPNSERVDFRAPTETLTVSTGDGTDVVTLETLDAEGASPAVVLLLGPGADAVNATDYTEGIQVSGGEGMDVVLGSAGDDLIDGQDGNDILFGQDGDDILYGGSGDDVLFGGRGDDTLYGGPGTDVLIGGSGSDALDGGDGFDISLGGEREAVRKRSSASKRVKEKTTARRREKVVQKAAPKELKAYEESSVTKSAFSTSWSSATGTRTGRGTLEAGMDRLGFTSWTRIGASLGRGMRGGGRFAFAWDVGSAFTLDWMSW